MREEKITLHYFIWLGLQRKNLILVHLFIIKKQRGKWLYADGNKNKNFLNFLHTNLRQYILYKFYWKILSCHYKCWSCNLEKNTIKRSQASQPIKYGKTKRWFQMPESEFRIWDTIHRIRILASREKKNLEPEYILRPVPSLAWII